MRNLILFIQRFYVFFIFLLLFALSLFILISYNYYQRASFINTANTVTGTTLKSVNNFRNYFKLSLENDRLREENARLRNIMRESYYVDTVTAVKVEDTVYKQHYTYIPAGVIKNSVNRKDNYITLNKGRRHGVQKDQGVICDDGVVGIVVNVSDHFCTVMSLLNRRISISPKVEDKNYFGSVKWDTKDPRFAQLVDINMFAPVKIGQKVSTSGFSYHFPQNVMIGTIQNIELKEGNNFYDIEIALSTNFITLSSVYIVQNKFIEELNTLEKNTEGDN